MTTENNDGSFNFDPNTNYVAEMHGQGGGVIEDASQFEGDTSHAVVEKIQIVTNAITRIRGEFGNQFDQEKAELSFLVKRINSDEVTVSGNGHVTNLYLPANLVSLDMKVGAMAQMTPAAFRACLKL